MLLYLLLNIGALSAPLIFSFHRRIRFIELWKPTLISLTITAVVFIGWDIVFTEKGIWGFNPDYLIGIDIANLPLEEWLFFFCINYACVFTHVTLTKLIPEMGVGLNTSKWITWALLAFLCVVVGANLDRAYTAVNLSLCIVLLAYAWAFAPKLLAQFYITFLPLLIPFFIINGVLTGTGIEDQVVWYNDAENLGIRMNTIPIEDIGYAFNMILMNLLLLRSLRKKFTGSQAWE